MISGLKVIKKGNDCVTLHFCVSALVMCWDTYLTTRGKTRKYNPMWTDNTLPFTMR